MRRLLPLLLALACGDDPPPAVPSGPVAIPVEERPALPPGAWRAELQSPGGPLGFGLEVGREPGATFSIVNGAHRARVERVEALKRGWGLTLDPYEATLTLVPDETGRQLVGTWKRAGQDGRVDELPVTARRGAATEPGALRGLDPLSGRWAVDLSGTDAPAILDLAEAGGRLHGTLVTPAGDLGWLEGRQDGERLQLSTFDGARAVLLTARLEEGGVLTGDLWSGSTEHQTFSATRDPEVRLPDAFELSRVARPEALATLRYTTLDGAEAPLAPLLGDAAVVALLGSWSPTSVDEAAVLQGLHERYGKRGLNVVGLAFERGRGDVGDAARVERVVAQLGLTFPILLAGGSAPEAAAEAFPVLDAIRAFPTTLFVKDGEVVAVHTGFLGPATGPAHRRLVEVFEAKVRGLLRR